MKLVYVTRTNICRPDAKSRQTVSMAKAFHDLLGQENFQLISAGRKRQSLPFAWIRIRVENNPWLRYWAACIAAIRNGSAFRPSIIFTRDIAVAFAVILAGGRAIYEAHIDLRGAVAPSLIKTAARCDRFRMVAISQALADYYLHRLKMPTERILVAHDGAFPEAYDASRGITKADIRNALGLPRAKKIVTHTGSLYKGGADLFAHIAGFDPENIEFVQVGGAISDQRYWSTYFKAQGIHNISFVPHQPPDKVRLYQLASDLLVYITHRGSPDHWCTSPLKVFEYMASGIPILAARIGSIGEILNDANAFCFDPDNPATIGAAMAVFMKDTQSAGRRSAAALQQLRDRYSWHRRANRIVAFASSR